MQRRPKELFMSELNDHQTTFQFNLFEPPPNSFFQGYCFVGSDLIFGEGGARRYENSTGKRISSGLDGCYVTISTRERAYVFQTDFAGYKALYYYHDGRTWVVSNSFAKIVDFLRSQRIPVTPNYAHLAAIAGTGMAAGQLFTFSTIVRDIQVVPPAHDLVVMPHSIYLERRPKMSGATMAYQDALSSHMNLWVSRFETLMVNKIANFTTDLTGGVDSRANFALVIAAQQRLGGGGDQPRLNCGSTPQNRSDIEVAHELTTHYGLELNDARRFDTYKLTALESFATFRDLSLGVYYPLYMPTKGPTLSDISISGGGGGIHRRIYANHQKSNDVNTFINSYAKRSGRPEYQLEFERDAKNMLALILEPGDDPLRALLRDGRVRYHTGRSARFQITFSPLHSSSAYAAQTVAGNDRTEEGQFNYDMMNSVDPELVEMPYDNPKKAPTDSIRARLTAAVINTEPKPGRVWSAGLSQHRRVSSSNSARIEELRKAFEIAMENPFVTAVWDHSLLNKATDLMTTMSTGGSIGNAANGKPIHAVLAANLAAPS